MKVYVAVDMEGVAGVVSWEETSAGRPDYERFRRLMTGEADAAIRGCFEAGADEVLVNDAHGSMRNLLIEELDPRAELMGGSPKPGSMVAGLDASFDAFVMIGSHSMAASCGVLNHTYSGCLLAYRINGDTMGEIGMCAALAGYYRVPTVFVSGDDAATAEAERLIPGVKTAKVKHYASRYAARSLHPSRSRELIRRSVADALRGPPPKPLTVTEPVELSLTFCDSAHADGHHFMPGSRRVDP
ncbi:MAG: M55 family metallopeptidase, partial [Bacillota bacterium]